MKLGREAAEAFDLSERAAHRITPCPSEGSESEPVERLVEPAGTSRYNAGSAIRRSAGAGSRAAT
jgi:hypothetical protein